VEYLPIADIDFTSASAKKSKLDIVIDSAGASSSLEVKVDVKNNPMQKWIIF